MSNENYLKRNLTAGQLRRLAQIKNEGVRVALADFEHDNATRSFPEGHLFTRDKTSYHSGNAERYMSGIVPDLITLVRLSQWGFKKPE